MHFLEEGGLWTEHKIQLINDPLNQTERKVEIKFVETKFFFNYKSIKTDELSVYKEK